MKKATVTLTAEARIFGLYRCTVSHREGRKTITLGERLLLGKSPRALADAGAKAGLKIVDGPSASSVFFLKGKRQPDGSIMDPVVDWSGEIVRHEKRNA